MTADRPSITIQSSDRYKVLRQVTSWQIDRIRQGTVLVAGAGALGNEILKNLALLGIGHIVLVDFDRVELPNLSRSTLFRAADNGQPKAETAAAAVRSINPDVKVTVINGDVCWEVGWGVFRRMDVILGGLDNRMARVALNQHSWRAGKPWVDGALTESAGTVRLFVPPDSACYECTLSSTDYQEMNVRFSCQGIALRGFLEGQIPTTPTIASIIGAMQVQEALKLLHGHPVLAGHELIYDGNVHTLQVAQLKRKADCLGHSLLGHVTEAQQFRAAHTTADQLLKYVQANFNPSARLELDREIVVGLKCPRGHATRTIFAPRYRLSETDVACQTCQEECLQTTTHIIDQQSPHLGKTLSEWGLPPGHILRARAGRDSRYYELSGDIAEIMPWTSKEN